MRALVHEREKALALRRAGYSYSEIVQKTGVSKSSLSLWLRDAPLTRAERLVLKERSNANILRGRIRAGSELRLRRLEREQSILKDATAEFLKHRKDPWFVMGVALYWAEGAKRNSGFSFVNSDPDMVESMVRWINDFLGVEPTYIKARLYIHKPYAHERLESFWSQRTHIPLENFFKTIYKPTFLLIKKRPNYKGCLRLELGQRAMLLKMLFWQNMLIKHYRIR